MAKIDGENVDKSEVAKQDTLRRCAVMRRWLELRRGVVHKSYLGKKRT